MCRPQRLPSLRQRSLQQLVLEKVFPRCKSEIFGHKQHVPERFLKLMSANKARHRLILPSRPKRHRTKCAALNRTDALFWRRHSPKSFGVLLQEYRSFGVSTRAIVSEQLGPECRWLADRPLVRLGVDSTIVPGDSPHSGTEMSNDRTVRT